MSRTTQKIDDVICYSEKANPRSALSRCIPLVRQAICALALYLLCAFSIFVFTLSLKEEISMSSLTFYLRSSRTDSSCAGSLCLRFIHQRKVKTLASSFQLFAHEWDHPGQSLCDSAPTAQRRAYLRQVAQYLNESRSKFASSIDEVSRYGSGAYSVETIVHQFKLFTTSNMLSLYCEKLAFGLQKSGQERTADAYLSAARGLKRFNKGKDIPLSSINCSLIKSYEHYLRENGKSPNTISFYMRNLRAIYNRAVEEHLIEHAGTPFKDVYTGVQVTRKRALNKDELNRLDNLDLLHKKMKKKNKNKSVKQTPPTSPIGKTEKTEKIDVGLYQSQRYFLFCFHARGMSFVDLAYLQKKNISGDILRYYRKKTGHLIEMKITEAMQEIFDSFSEEVSNSLYLFPIITDPKKSPRLQYESALRIHNKRLKILARRSAIDKNVSSHVARHSWATIGKYEKLPLWIISEGLGHSNEKTTYTYLASFDQWELDQANQKIGRAIQR